MLTPVLPDTPGKANIPARSAQMTDIRWTPLRDIPTYIKATGKQNLQLEPGCYSATHSATGDTVSFRVIRPEFQGGL